MVSAVAVGALLAGPAHAAASSGKTELVTKPPSGAAPTGPGRFPEITPDGRYVVFQSLANNLTSKADSNTYWDVFVRDLKTGVTKTVSTGLKGAPANGDSTAPDISANGRYVAFISEANNLVKGDQDKNNLAGELFIKDLKTGKTTRAFTGPRPDDEYGSEYQPSISDNGAVVAFDSSRSTLVPNDTNGDEDVFVWKRSTGKITRVSVTSSGAEAGSPAYEAYADSLGAEISGDGKTVVFQSGENNLVKNDTNNISDVFLHSLVTHRTTRISVGPKGQQATGGYPDRRQGAATPSISSDGQTVLYSGASLKGLVPQDVGDYRQVYVYHRKTGKTQLAVRTPGGGVVNDHLNNGVLSPDGRFISFETSAPGLVKGDTDTDEDVFVRDLKAGRTVRASVGPNGADAKGWSGGFANALSANGRRVVFTSDATGLVTNPIYGDEDLYVHTFPKNFWAK